MTPAYLLVAHGSRDPRPAQAVDRLADALAPHLPDSPIATAALECHPQPLHEQLREFGDRVQRPIHLVPLFLLAGVHVREDIPEAVEDARSQLPAACPLHVLPYLGSDARLARVLQQRLQGDRDAWIVLAHGSRRPGGNAAVEAAIAPLQADAPIVPAYWSVDPKLDRQIQQLDAAGHRRIGILPYFLCAGGITDAIARQVAEQQQTRPHLDLQLSDPLSDSPALIDVLLDLVRSTPAVAER